MENNTFFATVSEKNILSVGGAAVSDSVKFAKINFSFPKAWEGYSKTVVFKNGDTKRSVILNKNNKLCTGENECYIPYEILKTPVFTFSVYGILGDSKATTSWASIRVLKGCGEGDQPGEFTPSEFEQIVSILNNPLSNPLTDNVSGINAVTAESVSPAPQYLNIRVENEDGTPLTEVTELHMCGRNLIPYPYNIAETTTVNGVTFTDNGDGTITANGTAEEDVIYTFELQEEIIIPKGTYMLSGCPEELDCIQCQMSMYIDDKLAHTTFGGDKAVKGEVFATGKLSFKIYLSKGTVLENLIFKPQLEAGSVAHEYELYKKSSVIQVDPENPEPVLCAISPTFTLLSSREGVRISFEYICNLNTTIRNMWEIIATSARSTKIMAEALRIAFKDTAEEITL